MPPMPTDENNSKSVTNGYVRPSSVPEYLFEQVDYQWTTPAASHMEIAGILMPRD